MMDQKPTSNVPNRQPMVYAFTILMTVLATVAVALRMLARGLLAAIFGTTTTCASLLWYKSTVGRTASQRLISVADDVLID